MALLAASRYGMLAFHELGHIIHAWLMGGEGIRITFPLVGFSRTDLARNPHPLVVAAGGVVWGPVLPCVLWASAGSIGWKYTPILRFFAGFCLLANGGYLLSAAFEPAGDIEDMIRDGAAPGILIACGLAAMTAGLLAWHRLRPSLLALARRN
jgi:hypothetical protein